MIPLDQTEFSNREETVHGNCMSACLASLLEIPLSEVHNLAELGDKWFPYVWDILKRHGYAFHGTFYFNHPKRGERTFHEFYTLSPGVDGFVIVGGKSPREYVTRGHSVIYKYGVMAHDPHPSRAGLFTLEDAMMIERA